jgi:hypothetical protein
VGAGIEKAANRTVEELELFRNHIIALEQYVDDPDLILGSVKEMINKAINQIPGAALGEDARGRITQPWDPNDQINIAPPDPTKKDTSPPRKVPIAAGAPVGRGTDLLTATTSRNPYQPSAPQNETPEAADARSIRYLSRRSTGSSVDHVPEPGTPVVPLPSSNTMAAERRGSFDDRTGNRISSPQVNSTIGPWQPAPASASPVGALRGPNQPGPPQANRPLGIVSGQPMPDWPFPPPIWEFPNKSLARDDDDRDWLAHMLRTGGTY